MSPLCYLFKEDVQVYTGPQHLAVCPSVIVSQGYPSFWKGLGRRKMETELAQFFVFQIYSAPVPEVPREGCLAEFQASWFLGRSPQVRGESRVEPLCSARVHTDQLLWEREGLIKPQQLPWGVGSGSPCYRGHGQVCLACKWLETGTTTSQLRP